MSRYLLVGLITVTAVTGISATANAATFSVSQSQWNLAGLGYLSYSGIDGKVGTNTKSATRSFQNNRCLNPDGIIGPATTAELSALMKAVQGKVGTAKDGMNGPNTKAKIVAWQKRNGLKADGQAGPDTLKKMGIAYSKKCPKPKNPCASGTKDLGVHDTYVRGSRTSSRLCAIPGFRSSGDESRKGSKYYISGADGNVIVSYKSSGKTLAMFKAARASGVVMSAGSSFRTMAHQRAICSGDWGCRTGNSYGAVAKPGYSNHQSGSAIDINMSNSGYRSGASCTNGRRSKGVNSPTWNWLYKNAHKYGFRQYAGEAWHWEYTSPSYDRC